MQCKIDCETGILGSVDSSHSLPHEGQTGQAQKEEQLVFEEQLERDLKLEKCLEVCGELGTSID